MSDAAVATIVSGAITIVGMVVGFLTLWVKVRYGVTKAEEAATKAGVVEGKIEHNTIVTTEAKDAANKAAEHTAGCDEERARIMARLEAHDGRITALEGRMSALAVSVEGVDKNLNSTRHEMRGHLQAVTSKLDLLTLAPPRPAKEA